MKKLSIFSIFFIVLFVLLTPHNLFAIKKLGQTGLKFLDIGIGARASAMGEAFITMENDANAIFYNPAGIGKMSNKFDFTTSITDWIADITLSAAGFVFNAGKWGSFGLSIISPDYGTIAGTRVAPTEEGYEETGQLDVGAFETGLAYARQLTDKFTVGAKVKYAYEHLGSNLLPVMEDGEMVGSELEENKVSGLAYDFGTIFYPGFPTESFRFGMTISNFSPQFKYSEETFELPLTFKIGLAIDILDIFGEHPDRSFLVEMDVVHPRDYGQRLHFGGEYWYKDILAVRSGYKFNYDEEGLTLGLGLNMGGVKLSYAYSDFGVFNMVNRVSLGMAF
jgi:hypothetical protein